MNAEEIYKKYVQGDVEPELKNNNFTNLIQSDVTAITTLTNADYITSHGPNRYWYEPQKGFEIKKLQFELDASYIDRIWHVGVQYIIGNWSSNVSLMISSYQIDDLRNPQTSQTVLKELSKMISREITEDYRRKIVEKLIAEELIKEYSKMLRYEGIANSNRSGILFSEGNLQASTLSDGSKSNT
ncbi:hypothetical protein SCRM01_088c [Synechococcus phage S-CRM01]|uniref:hypothetical protein n=1 Tax=Synechococcus phage S-CRM01 TaxID=1026955 RepID=UPI000209E394|nr:hypothetical protein SCRM01_088c [Synechococcus phage S-CRM01]AEC53034.1 hypothetical protein SCRM01_088c [Synechococcus phage S-CRM01]